MLQTALPRSASAYTSGPDHPVSGAYKIDISRGERIGRVSSEWYSRPDDERYLSLSALRDAVRSRPGRCASKPAGTAPNAWR